MSDFESRVRDYQSRVEHELKSILPEGEFALHQAMSYAALNGGKRMRPLLVYGTGEALDLDPQSLDAVACAVELIHVYSLIHDDLPAMDDDDLRRGRPTCHLVFGEATAILAGDALQALAFSVLAGARHGIDDTVQIRQLKELAYACGSAGMAGGQALDLLAVGQRTTPEQLETMHAKKTGALIRTAIRMAAMTRDDLAAGEMDRLAQFGHYVGLAFQVQDDILDECQSTETLGKTAGRDRARNKPTYPFVLGLERARRYAQQLLDQALETIAALDQRAGLLRYLAHYAVNRTS